jgi:aspartyl/asparaginyl beta-hydroxylase (cupin superfamily)
VLKQVSNILTDDDPNNDESACGKFDTFISRVNAAAERRDNDDTLTTDQADKLRTQAEDIRDELLLLGC